ncbi:hypothetical protein ACOI1H_08650 [Loktanella sp. DJP18]|uniref:hypothetical protein n=1 Tax=Loktanella sp. DJP18 TaxID=3409788 RepID=UPI003BB4CC23
MSRLRDLYGTDEPPVPVEAFACGPWSFGLAGGALRHIALHGEEAVRGIAFLVRDRDWGTLVPQITGAHVDRSGERLQMRHTAHYVNGPGVLEVAVTVDVTPDRLAMRAVGRARGRFETNRAGFTVLHPIRDVAGQWLSVRHGDDTTEETRWPGLIAPWQPVTDIAALTHRVGGHLLRCDLAGDTFEMEDQRQWGDASFKTYNRPLARPWPYVIDEEAVLDQSVTLTWQKAARSVVVSPAPRAAQPPFPDMALVITPQDARRLAGSPADVDIVAPQRLLCHLDATLGDVAGQCAAFAAAQAVCPAQTFDLELVAVCAGDPGAELQAIAVAMAQAGFAPASMIVCPAVDRQSTPPGSEWPDCPPLEAIHAAAAVAFAGLIRGGGMVSFFPELNRKRPPMDLLDFVAFGLCPIVHDAGDAAVMETLEAVPAIMASARHIAGDRAVRIGPATIAMRQNPYGSRTIPNPGAERLCMTDDDPRHRARFGAAYALGLAAALAPAGAKVWTPAGLYGPRGAEADWPITQVLRALARVARQTVQEARVNGGRAVLAVGDTTFAANLTDRDRPDLPAYGWRMA